MIVEIRTYTVKPGQRAAFLEIFEHRTVPAMRATGMSILGPLLDLEKPDVFHWLRAFASPAERDRIRNAFYDGPAWKDELADVVMPMLESYFAAITEVPDGFVDFNGSKHLTISPLNVPS
jgi:hypothetical protein